MDADSAYDGLEDLEVDSSLSRFKGKEHLRESSYSSSSSNPKAKKLKVISKKKGPPTVNPAEPVRESWIKVPSDEFENDRLIFNPYAFGKPTCTNDSRFYCKMHQQVFE